MRNWDILICYIHCAYIIKDYFVWIKCAHIGIYKYDDIVQKSEIYEIMHLRFGVVQS